MADEIPNTDVSQDGNQNVGNDSGGFEVVCVAGVVDDPTGAKKAAFGVHWPGHPLDDCSGRISGVPSKLRAHLCGAIHAIETAKKSGISKLCVYSESDYLCDLQLNEVTTLTAHLSIADNTTDTGADAPELVVRGEEVAEDSSPDEEVKDVDEKIAEESDSEEDKDYEDDDEGDENEEVTVFVSDENELNMDLIEKITKLRKETIVKFQRGESGESERLAKEGLKNDIAIALTKGFFMPYPMVHVTAKMLDYQPEVGGKLSWIIRWEQNSSEKYFDLLDMFGHVCGKKAIRTERRAHLLGAIQGIRMARDAGVRTMTIRTDSDYLINVMNVQIEIWKRREWRPVLEGNEGAGGKLRNLALLRELEVLRRDITVIMEQAATGHNADEMLPDPTFDRKFSTFSEKGYSIISTDGASKSNGKAGAWAGWGIVNELFEIEKDAPEGNATFEREFGRVTGRQTNNRAELTGALKALEFTKKLGRDKVLVLMDSLYAVTAMTFWIAGWQDRGWIKQDGSPVANIDLFQKLEELRKGRKVVFQHIYRANNSAADEASNYLFHEEIKISDVVYLSRGDSDEVCSIWSVFWLDESKRDRNEIELVKTPTGRRAELAGAIYAIETAIELGMENLFIVTDCNYLINEVDQWADKQCAREWKTKRNDDVFNVDLLEKLMQLRLKLSFVFNCRQLEKFLPKELRSVLSRKQIENQEKSVNKKKRIFYEYCIDFKNVYIGSKKGEKNVQEWKVYVSDTEKYAGRLKGGQTENRAVLKAAIEAISQLCSNQNPVFLRIHTACEYVTNAMNKGIFNWKKNGWKKKDGNPVQNRDLIEELHEARTKKGIIFFHLEDKDNADIEKARNVPIKN